MRQPYRIESVTLNKIGVFENTHFDFPQISRETEDATKAEIHILTGPNGCGKSTVLYALAGIFNPQVDADFLVRGRYREITSNVNFHFCGLAGEYGVKLDKHTNVIATNDRYYYSIDGALESVVWQNRPSWDVYQNLQVRTFDYVALAYSGSRALQSGYYFSAIQNINVSPFENSLSFDKTVRPQLLAQWLANNRTQAVLAKSDGAEEEAKQFDNAINRITTFVNDICQLDLKFHLERNPLEIKVSLGGKRLSLDILPDGLKSIISWIADMALRLESIPWKQPGDIFSQPIILLLDEVDIHLHPKWQRRILPAIQKLLPNGQVFVSTHSPFVVGSVEDAFVHRLHESQKNSLSDASKTETVPVEKSGAGKSYQLILAEVFDVEEEFDVETEHQLTKFKQAIHQHLQNPQDDADVMQLAQTLREKSEELATLVSMELRQMNRLLSAK
ncbi:AAA family ATPase [Enterobacter asburiae]|uniref:AAA family ATPase n=1 Tax=Enterobacter asburiae TaxID=61645 RepID=UPI001574F40E|nr:AAA family ATPase [Enterobacter asburiae]NQF31933.1 ATP-binding cassette domain-containing protein [Enterobacter asburiae]HCM9117307.1 AAA family ATPase [Enterobacter asburiae]